jgi:hypothetical protein
VREKLEVTFADWVMMQERRKEFRHLDESFGLAESYAEPRRAAARARVAEAVAARSGEQPEPQSLGARINRGATALMLNTVLLTMGGPQALAGAQEQALDLSSEPERVRAELTEEEAAAEKAIARGITLADTRAREFLNSHYNDVQDAVRDFVTSAEQQIDELPGPPSAYAQLVPTLFGAVMGVVGARYPAEAIGKIIATAAASATVSGAATVASTQAGDDHEARQAAASQTMQALASSVGNSQAGLYTKARQALASELSLVAATEPESRMLLQEANRDAVDAVITGPLGIPHPDDLSLYADVREELDVPFHHWIQGQRWLLEGLSWLTQFRADETSTRRQIAADAALREGAEAPADAGETQYLDLPDETVTPQEPALPLDAPAGAQAAEGEAARDRLVLKRLVDVDSRARAFLNGHHDAVQDAVRDFVASANTRLDADKDQVSDVLGMISTISGVVTTFMFTSMPVVGAVIGGALAVGLQAAGSYYADQALSKSANARRALRRFARDGELALVSGFKKARAGLGPLLLTLALTDDDVRAALEIGGQDQIDAVIAVGLRISDPDSASTYDDLRKALEEEFVRWLSAEQELDEAETEAAVQQALADADEDARLRRGDKQARMPDKKGKAG